MTEIQTDFSIEEISILEEESSQVGLRALIAKICESRGMEHIVEEELLKPLEGTGQAVLLKCFISVLETFALQRNEMIVFLKETIFTSDQSSRTEMVDLKSPIFDESNTMASYNVSSEQPLNTVSSAKCGYKGLKVISENVSSLENISMVSGVLKLAINIYYKNRYNIPSHGVIGIRFNGSQHLYILDFRNLSFNTNHPRLGTMQDNCHYYFRETQRG